MRVKEVTPAAYSVDQARLGRVRLNFSSQAADVRTDDSRSLLITHGVTQGLLGQLLAGNRDTRSLHQASEYG